MARILLGVSGGIAAYKAVEVVRLATKAGHSVRVVQTPAAQKFVGAATFEGITGAPVLTGEFDRDPARGAYPGEPSPDHDPISHLELVRRCDAYVIAPATANTIAKLAAGLADNLLTSAALACTSPLVVAPAMNNAMYEHAATRANIETLRKRGVAIVDPGTGPLASKGEWGEGRLASPPDILAAIEAAGVAYLPRSLEGVRILVTAGGTREPIDAVRVITNRSSGKQGHAIAEEAAARGATVTLVTAAKLPVSAGIEVVRVSTVADFERVVLPRQGDVDVIIQSAAMSDFRPKVAADRKIKKDEGLSEIVLEPTHDFSVDLGKAKRPGQTLVGFAAETDDLIANAEKKIRAKNLDLIVANDVGAPGVGFEHDTNAVSIISSTGIREDVPLTDKRAIARVVRDAVRTHRETNR